MIHMERSRRLAVVWGLVFVWFPVMVSVGAVQAAKVTYTLDNVVLADGESIAGTFDWTYNVGDFAGGSGVFTALEIPWLPAGSAPPLQQPGMVFVIENTQIEISLDGNFHDYGLNIILRFPSNPLSPTASSPIDTGSSFFECCGNGFKDQPFVSGTISPVDLMDAVIDLQLLSGVNLSATSVGQTDVNADRRIDMADVLYILQYVSGLR